KQPRPRPNRTRPARVSRACSHQQNYLQQLPPLHRGHDGQQESSATLALGAATAEADSAAAASRKRILNISIFLSSQEKRIFRKLRASKEESIQELATQGQKRG